MNKFILSGVVINIKYNKIYNEITILQKGKTNSENNIDIYKIKDYNKNVLEIGDTYTFEGHLVPKFTDRYISLVCDKINIGGKND